MDELVWDQGNLAHLDERNAERRAAGIPEITREEVDALYQSADYEVVGDWYVNAQGHEVWQERLIGRTPEGRYLTIVCDVLDDGRYRPATIWRSTRREILAFERTHRSD
jgi:arginase family enzyme